MKKKLEADLISIAHRILKLKNKSDINQLYLETQKLYEKLAILKFVDENFDTAKPTIGLTEIQSQVEEAFEKETVIPQIEATIEEEVTIETATNEEIKIEETITELPVSKIIEEEPTLLAAQEEENVFVGTIHLEENEEEENSLLQEEDKKAIEMVTETSFSSFSPAFEIDDEEEEIVDEVEEPKVPAQQKAVQISFEDLMGINYSEAQFVKVDDIEFVTPSKKVEFQEKEKEVEPEIVVLEKAEPKAMSLNERLAKGINIDLNDRLAFTKHLFGNSSEDYNRVLNQLITFDTFGETKQFIEDMVKPDYNNWEGKDDYAHRFMEILEKKFL